MIIQRYHSKGKNKHMLFTLLSFTFVQGFYNMIWTSLPCFWLIVFSQPDKLQFHWKFTNDCIWNWSSSGGFESRVSSSIRCESYLSWIWISIFDSGSFRTGLYMRIFHLIWSCLSSVFSMDSSYKCLRVSCRLWLTSWFISWLLEVFILTCLNKAWVFFLRISIL